MGSIFVVGILIGITNLVTQADLSEWQEGLPVFTKHILSIHHHDHHDRRDPLVHHHLEGEASGRATHYQLWEPLSDC